MQPFNLEKALAGAKLVTRDGREVTGFKKNIGKPLKPDYCYHGILEDRLKAFNASGTHLKLRENDLFLADEVEQPKTLIPFDLKRALAGDKLVTQDGRSVSGFQWRELTRAEYPYSARVSDSVRLYFETGLHMNMPEFDLFMAEPATVQTLNLPALVGKWVKCVEGDGDELRNGIWYRVAAHGVFVGDNGGQHNVELCGHRFDLSNPIDEKWAFANNAMKAEPAPHSDEVEQPKNILQQANDLIYGERQNDYGSATTNFTNIAKGWAVIFADGDFTPERVGLAMAWVKVCRQTNKPKHDNLVDIAGYIGCIDKIGRGE